MARLRSIVGKLIALDGYFDDAEEYAETVLGVVYSWNRQMALSTVINALVVDAIRSLIAATSR